MRVTTTRHRPKFRYFALDVQQSTPELQEKEAIAYRFETERLFYPLVVSKLGGQGDTLIRLLVLTPGKLTKFTGLPKADIAPSTPQPVTLTAQQLADLDKTVSGIMTSRGETGPFSARDWEIAGKLTDFEADLFAAP